MIYLNHAGTSWPKAPPVAGAMMDALAESPLGWGERFEEAHRAVARFLGVRDTGRLLLAPACTSALAVGVADHPWEAGDRIVVSGLEHHALHRPALALADRGVEVCVLPRSEDGPLSLDALEGCLRRGRVRMVAICGASNVTGELLPFREAAALARAHGALFLLDAAQIAGWTPLDVAELGVDLLAFAGHKGPQGPWGIGGLYVAPGVAMRSPAALCEVPAAGAGKGPRGCATMPGYCDLGSVDRAALAGLAAAVDWLAAPAQAGRLGRARARIGRLRSALAGMPGVRLLGAGGVEASMPVVAFTAAGCSPSAVARELAARGVVVAAGLACAPLAHETLGTAPEGVIRASAGPGTSEEEIEAAIGALDEAIRGLAARAGAR